MHSLRWLFITGCAQQTFTVRNKPAAVAPKETIICFFVSERAEENCRCSQRICGDAENVIKQTNKHSVNGLLGFITLLYSAGSACVLLTIIA